MENINNRGGMRGPGMGRRPAEKSKDFKGTWMKIIRYCKRYLAVIVVALICAVAGTILTILGPDKLSDLTKVITEGIATGIDMERVKFIGLTLVAFYVGSAILSFGQQFIMATVTQNVTKQLRSDISGKINRLPMAYYNKTSTGDVLSRVTNDVDMISQSMNQSIGNLVSAVALFFGSLIMMFKTNVIMTLTAVIATMIGFGLMSLITSHSQKYFSRQQANLGALNGHIEEIYSGHTVVKAYNGEKNAKKVFDELNNNLRDSAFKAQSLSGLMQPLMAFIGNFGYVAVCVMGAVLTMKGYIGFEVIVAFMMYIRLFTQPLAQIAQATQSLQSAAAAGERVFAFLGAEEMSDESDKTEKLGKAEGYVDFEHVKFGYEDTDKIIIHDFSAKAKPGQKIAIVGPTGAGKTTLINLLMRFYDVDKGAIRIDGIDTKSMSRSDVRSLFGMVLQDAWLYQGTIADNIRFGKLDATDYEVVDAAKTANVDHFIRTMPDGYDMAINSEGDNVSLGQKQLLTIARAVVSDPKILILDEATSSVDTRLEALIQKAMDRVMEGRTSFVIAHRLSTIRDADLILVMDQGQIIEKGTHESLLAQGGFYEKLYNSQFAEEAE